MYAYAGRYLRVNLSKDKIFKEDLPKDFLKYVGGQGFAFYVLFKELEQGVDPLGPENKLVIAAGPSNGTIMPGSCRCTMAAKSPLSGFIGDSNASGRISAELKYAGYDFIVIEGRAKSPVYLYIDDEYVELREAQHLWGLTTDETRESIEQELGDPEIAVVSIGPAGENLVKFACVISDTARAFGRCGLGAVMGSKKIKAIAVRGSKGVSVADADELEKAINELYQLYRKYHVWYNGMLRYGVIKDLDRLCELGTIPVKNYQTVAFKKVDSFDPETIEGSYLVTTASCFSCPVGCNHVWVIRDEPYRGTYGEAFELMQPLRFGLFLDNKNLNSIFKMSAEANRLGLDFADLTGVIAFALECADNGIIDRDLIEGVQWGDYEGILKLFRKIAFREGIGDILAEGLIEAPKKLGKGSEKYSFHVKGLALDAYDPRTVKGWGLGYAISSRGADHCRHFYATERDSPDRLATEGKAEAIVWHENVRAFQNAMGTCAFSYMLPEMINPDLQARFFNALTGNKISSSDVLRLGERIVNLARAFNLREGLTKADDMLPSRFLETPIPEGPAKGELIDLKYMVDKYYELRGWDKETGLLTERKLIELDMDEVINELKKHKKIVSASTS